MTITRQQRALLLALSDKRWRSAINQLAGDFAQIDADGLVGLGLAERRQSPYIAGRVVYRRTPAGRRALS
jgi:hypothetical protein